ncbi:nucleoside monophosphate kinase [Candidatus Nomurabacteria bacterium]|nr:nucleoside monophosphate kinase [Candidatus Nomurabacteria bacterium]
MQIDEKVSFIKKWLGTGSINIFGLPYAGKDTHGGYLAGLLDASLLGGGDILRNSKIPSHVQKIIDSGGLAPTEDYVRIVLPYLSDGKFKDRPLVLSSVGRWHGEEDGVIAAAEQSGHPLKAVIYLHITIQTANERFKKSKQNGDRGNRADDDHDKLIVRFSEFAEKTLPVIDYYRQKQILLDIDGNPPVDEVRKVIVDQLYELALQSRSE